jgi:L-ascorbate metabolism protein UlaG (beta-lactamase superfamily)
MALVGALWTLGNDAPTPVVLQRPASGEGVLTYAAPTGFYRFEGSDDLATWSPIATALSNGAPLTYTDTAGPYLGKRFYRAVPVPGTAVFTGDHLVTSDGVLTFRPINHASFVIKWVPVMGPTKMIYCDPVGSGTLYAGMPKADIILITHSHSDHFLSSTIESVRTATTRLIVPQAVYTSLSATQKTLATVFKTGQALAADNTLPLSVLGLSVSGIPAYNGNHALGTGNAYVLTIGGRKVFLSGDTGPTPEMRALTGIDVAFVCMNIPFTMTIAEAVADVRAFQPKVVYPYHYRNSGGGLADVEGFKTQVGTDRGVEVRLRAWY